MGIACSRRGAVNSLSVSFSTFHNTIDPTSPGLPQLTFPSILDGSSFRVPQGTDQRRWQFADTVTRIIRGSHTSSSGGEFQRVDAGFDLGVFRDGRIEFVQDFPDFDRNGDGKVDDNDLLFAVTLRSGHPEPGTHTAELRQQPRGAASCRTTGGSASNLTFNVGVRYEIDTRRQEHQPATATSTRSSQPFLHGRPRTRT